MKRAIVLMILLAILPGVVSAGGRKNEPVSGWVLCQPDSKVNIREKPKKTAEVVAWGYAGDEIQLDGRKRGKWLHVIIPCETGEGWIRADYVSLDPPEDVGSGKFETLVNRVRVRASAGGRVIRRLKKGVTVTVSIVTAEWCVTNVGFIKTSCLMEVP